MAVFQVDMDFILDVLQTAYVILSKSLDSVVPEDSIWKMGIIVIFLICFACFIYLECQDFSSWAISHEVLVLSLLQNGALISFGPSMHSNSSWMAIYWKK